MALPHEEKEAARREIAEHRPSGQKDTPGMSQPVDLTNLFAGILMDDEREEMEEDAAVEEGGCSSVTQIECTQTAQLQLLLQRPCSFSDMPYCACRRVLCSM